MAESSVSGQQTVRPIVAYYTGSDTLYNGYALCYDHDGATAKLRSSTVEKPTYASLLAGGFAGIVVNAPAQGIVPASGATRTKVYLLPVRPSGMEMRDVDVFTDQNVTAGQLLGPSPETYYFRQAVIPGTAVFRCSEAKDRSGTANTVNGVYVKIDAEEYQDKMFRIFDHFDGRTPIFLGGATLAEFLLPGYQVSGATVAAAGTSDHGGRLVITPTTTTIAQLEMGGTGTASAANLLPFTLSAGKAIYFRANVNFGVGAVDNDVFCGLAITGAAVTDGTVPNLDDYLGFYMQGDSSALINIATNRDNGTDNVTSTGITQVADTMHDLAFLAVNRVAGDAASATTVYVFVDGVLTNTLSSAAVNALINKDEGMRMVFAGIGGAAAVALEIDRWECCTNL